MIYAHDCAIVYDAGWRAYCGLRPHADFYSALGPFLYLYIGAGFWLFGTTIHAVAYMNALALAILTGAVWFLLRNRMGEFWLFLSSLMVGLCFMAPYTMRNPTVYLSYALLYNRHGYALIMLLYMLLFLPRGTASLLQLSITSFVIGSILSVLLFAKVSFFMAVVPVTLFYFFLCRGEEAWIDLKSLAGGFILMSVAFAAYIRFDLMGMYRDLSIASGAKKHHFAMHWDVYFATVMEMMLPAMLCMLITVFGAIWKAECEQKKFSWRMVVPHIMLVCVLVLSSGFVVFTCAINNLDVDYPLLTSLGVIMFVRAVSRNQIPALIWKGMPTAYVAILLLAGYPAVSQVWRDTYSIVQIVPPPEYRMVFNTPALQDLVIYPTERHVGYPPTTNDAVNLIYKHNIAGRKLMSTEFTSLFPFATHSPSAGGSVFLESPVNISMDSHPTAEQMFADAEYLFLTKNPISPRTVELIHAVYDPYIHKHYQKLDETPNWLLMERRDIASAAGR
jgi:hypothetical protein